jgi:hypothetical protein
VYSPLLPLLGARALSPEEESSLREHLVDCAWCQNQLAAYAVVEEALRSRYASAPSAQALTMEDVVRASQSDPRPAATESQIQAQSSRATDLSDWSDSRPVTHGRDPRRPKPWATLGAVAAVALLVALAAALFANMRLRTPSDVASANCATILSGATPATIITSFSGLAFPNGAVMTPVKSTLGGPSQFTILDTDICYNGSSSDYLDLAGPGWRASQSFPYQGAALQPCAEHCYQTVNSGYIAVSQIVDRGNSVFTYHLRLAAPPPAPTCEANFSNSPLQGVQTSIDGAPLPPLTFIAPDNAPNLRGYDLCSSGTAASVAAFLTSALPATGWTKATNARCFYADQCWTRDLTVISWHVDDPTNWRIAYRVAAS